MRKSRIITTRSNGHIVTTGLVSILICALLCFGIFKAQPWLSLSVTKDTYNWYPYPEEPNAHQAHIESKEKIFADRTIFVMGDSHAGAYSTMLSMLQNETGASVIAFSKAGCSVANFLTTSTPECAIFIADSIQKITEQSRPGDIVFLASLRMNRLSDQWSTFDESGVVAHQNSSNAKLERQAALQEARQIIKSFEAASLTVVMDAPKPVFKSPPFRCLDWFNSKNPVCEAGLEMSRSFLLRHRQPAMESMRLIAEAHPEVIVWDLFPILCPSDVCTTSINGQPLFFDADHLSGHGNRVLYPSFSSLVRSIWLKE